MNTDQPAPDIQSDERKIELHNFLLEMDTSGVEKLEKYEQALVRRHTQR